MNEINNKLESPEALLQKIVDEVEILENIFFEEGLVLSPPEIVESTLSTQAEGSSNEEDE